MAKNRAKTEILELRVHGVSNTPPTSMLDLPADKIERADGDDLGSFWTPTAEARAEAVARPPDHRHRQRSDVTREAYSWGAMARATNLPLGDALGAVARGAARAAWTLVLPFGLANTAYWARPIHPGRQGDTGASRASRGTAIAVRLYGLLLTLLTVSSFATVGLSLVASQCFRPLPSLPSTGMGPDQPVAAVCTQLPDSLKALASRTPGQRTALVLVAVAVLVVLLWLLSTLGRVRYEERTSARHATATSPGSRSPSSAALLATPGFWSHARLTLASTLLHVAGALALLVGIVAWDRVFGGVWACRDIRTITDAACLRTTTREPDFLVLLVVAVVLLVLVGHRLAVDSAASVDVPAPARRSTTAHRHAGAAVSYLVAVSILFAGTLARLWALPADGAVHDPRLGSELSSLMVAPTALVALLLALAISALTWRDSRRPWTTIWAAVLATVALTAAAMDLTVGDVRLSGWLEAVGAALLLAIALRTTTALLRPRKTARRHEGWRGAGPGVFLLLATATSMVLCSLLVTGTAAYLNGPADGARLAVPPEHATAAEAAWKGGPVFDVVPTSPAPAVHVAAPAAYVEFATATLLVVAATVVVLIGMGVRRALSRAPLEPRGKRYPNPGDADLTPRALARILTARRNAAELQRAEVILGTIAALSFVVLVLTLLTEARSVTAADDVASLVEVRAQWAPILLNLTPTQAALPVAAVGAVALLVVGSMVAASGTGGVTRPLGIVWDILCFLPRAAHPFGPPCYAERAVPELRGRIDAWLTGGERGKRRVVVVSAHSLGALLTIAALFARDEDGWDDVGLLTYGVQVRPYFGRFLPDLLGPATLGVPPSKPPSAFATDPWGREIAEGSATATPLAGALTSRLHGGRTGPPAWVSLWRRSDYLGFPAWGYAPNDVDRLAEEDDRTTYLFSVATHSGYPRTVAYHRALDEVLARLRVRGATPPVVATLQAPAAGT